MTALVDTDVLVDAWRGLGAARAWLASARQEDVRITGVVAMEMVVGCRDQADLLRMARFLDDFDIVWPDEAVCATAYDLLRRHHLATRLGIPDALNAAIALRLGVRLYSFNLKHYRAISGLDCVAPYERG